jgi:hypothetical protein
MAGRWVDWVFRSRATGRLTVVQMPNAALVVFAACRVAQAVFSPHGSAGVVLRVTGDAALAWWALDEVFRGVNPFRRFLGAAALSSLLL